MDLVFLLDSSGSVGRANFDRLKKLIIEVVKDTSIDDGKVRVGVVTFSSSSHVEFYLNSYNSRNDIESAIKNINYKQGNTNIASGLKTANTNVFQTWNGDRKDVRNVLLLLVDGRSNMEESQTIPAATIAKKSGIHIFVVGIKQANNTELKAIASGPPGKNMVNVQSFNKLDQMKKLVSKYMCTGLRSVTTAQPSPRATTRTSPRATTHTSPVATTKTSPVDTTQTSPVDTTQTSLVVATQTSPVTTTRTSPVVTTKPPSVATTQPSSVTTPMLTTTTSTPVSPPYFPKGCNTSNACYRQCERVASSIPKVSDDVIKDLRLPKRQLSKQIGKKTSTPNRSESQQMTGKVVFIVLLAPCAFLLGWDLLDLLRYIDRKRYSKLGLQC
ncbi:collagen alpha-1(XII) chain-like [Haliotis rufescens]|uniref:collagen alpha-1(XII) chain-like n=1 Tax=Haliotis rufescens TaxID=6454 RepID=UPI00201EB78E|nr:collagen alpha-1(XII) chain-like [Haliotis rufescens]